MLRLFLLVSLYDNRHNLTSHRQVLLKTPKYLANSRQVELGKQSVMEKFAEMPLK